MTTSTPTENRSRQPRVLFVDDEPFVLDALRRTTRNAFDATFAEGGQAALKLLETDEAFDVLCTDMRMPGVDGLEVLKKFKEHAPDTSRVLLTGQSDLDTAVLAVNEANVFRFLLKPTDPDQLRAAIADAVELRRLRLSERELLEQTLRGSVQALFEILSLSNPVAFARAVRIRSLVVALLEHITGIDKWEVEVATMLSQLGAVTLPPGVSDRLDRGLPLDRADQKMVDELPGVVDRLLSPIPRIDDIRHIIWSQGRWERPDAPLATKLIVFASELDTLTERGLEKSVLASMLRERTHDYSPQVIEAFTALSNTTLGDRRVLLVKPGDLLAGMILAGDVRTCDAIMLVGRGQEVTNSLIARISNFATTVGLEESTIAVFEKVELGSHVED